MEKNLISPGDKKDLITNSVFFLKEFESHFIEYFTCLCISYDTAIDKEEAQSIALFIYQSLFKCNNTSENLKEGMSNRMRKDSIMIGFLINRSMLFLIEEYLIFTKKYAMDSHLELLIHDINSFVHLLESDMAPKLSHATSICDMGFSDDILLSHNNKVIDIFSNMKNNQQSVVFLNFYKGVPISSKASVIDIDGENVTFKIDRLQEMAMKLEGEAFIVKNEYFSKHLKADILDSNFQTNTVILTNFIYLFNRPAVQREYTRVYPDITTNVYLHHVDNLQTSGRLQDLSMSGLGVVSNENHGVNIGSKILIAFELNSSSVSPSSDQKIEVQGEVINIIEQNDSFCYCVRIFPDYAMGTKISHYITLREKEILEDLKRELQQYDV